MGFTSFSIRTQHHANFRFDVEVNSTDDNSSFADQSRMRWRRKAFSQEASNPLINVSMVETFGLAVNVATVVGILVKVEVQLCGIYQKAFGWTLCHDFFMKAGLAFQCSQRGCGRQPRPLLWDFFLR